MTAAVIPESHVNGLHGRQGAAHMVFAAGADGVSRLVSCEARSPLRVLSPGNGGRGAWAYTSSFGGGLLAGDENRVKIEVGEGAMAYVSTQSATKVFRSGNGEVSRQTLEAGVCPGATLALLPDPVACFRGARYRQRQRFEVAATGSLILLDTLTSGRHARGECWNAEELGSRNEMWVNGRCVMRDAVEIRNGALGLGMREYNCIATLIMLGPVAAPHAERLWGQLSAAAIDAAPARAFGASRLGDGLMIRVAGVDAEAVTGLVFSWLGWLGELLGERPWNRKW